MVFYEIRIHSQPKIRFACSVQTAVESGCKNIIDHRKNIMELGIHEHDILVKTESGEHTIPKMAVGLYMPDDCYTITTPASVLCGTSIAVEIDDWEYIRHDTENVRGVIPLPDKEDIFTVFLPQISELSEEEFSLFAALLKNVISSYMMHTAAANLRCLSGWYEMVSILDRAFRRQIFGELGQERNSGYYYAYKARKYICAHFRENLTLQSVADHLGISVNYCSTIFRKETGQTVLEYITGLRMQEIRTMMHTEPEMSLREVCESVGLHDIRHAQRTFKKYHGISMQKCRQIDRGLSLYHTNPWEKEELDHDIFGDETE